MFSDYISVILSFLNNFLFNYIRALEEQGMHVCRTLPSLVKRIRTSFYMIKPILSSRLLEFPLIWIHKLIKVATAITSIQLKNSTLTKDFLGVHCDIVKIRNSASSKHQSMADVYLHAALGELWECPTSSI